MQGSTPPPQAPPQLSPQPAVSQPPIPHATPAPISSIPLKRAHEDNHTPSISSPLNPDPKPRPVQREQREKKDSLKKREAAGLTTPPATAKVAPKGKKVNGTVPVGGLPSPIRYNHPLPAGDSFHYATRDTVLGSCEPEPLFQATAKGPTELKRPVDMPENKKTYRYGHCIADPSFAHMRYYRCTDDKPYGARMSFTDSDKNILFDDTASIIRNEKGWRMSRANVCVREGSFYFEVKILRGGPTQGSQGSEVGTGRPQPHVRVGWSRREAPLDAPVGFDGYSYGVTDIRMEPMHKSRANKFLDNGIDPPPGKKKPPKPSAKPAKAGAAANAPPTTNFAANDNLREGDVVGMLINLPSISLHRKVVEGYYNPAVDTGTGFDAPSLDDEGTPNVVRDRFPVPYRSAMYFESLEYKPSKGMESYGDRGPFQKEQPSPNHDDPTLRSLPHSSIKVYKNGKMVGTAFRDLMAFLPPASIGDKGKDAKDKSFDDGMVGYFPTVAVFSGGVAQTNFGPAFWFPPAGLDALTTDKAAKRHVKQEDTVMSGTDEHEVSAEAFIPPSRRTGIRAVGERYEEQVVEDIIYDIIDEVDFFVQDAEDRSK